MLKQLRYIINSTKPSTFADRLCSQILSAVRNSKIFLVKKGVISSQIPPLTFI
nr:MAG TPA: hypothetical protein [Caudoviricetes sp.]